MGISYYVSMKQKDRFVMSRSFLSVEGIYLPDV